MRVTSKLAIVWVASTAWTATAQAQQAPAAETTAQDQEQGEILVTAQRREERLLDVPISISALNSAALERAAVQSVNEIQSVIPNLQINQSPGNSFSPVISIRGLAPSADTSLARDQPVGLYLDGVPISKANGAAFDTVDLERVEVLRGPQGTLYGRNTIGGAINLITRPPSGELGGSIWLSYGQRDQFQRRASIDLPAVADISIRLSTSSSDRDGYWRNAATRSDFNGQSLDALRADVMWRPTENFSLRYTYDITDAEGTPTLLAVNAIGAALPAAFRPLVTPFVFTERPGRDAVSAQSALQSDFRVTGHALTMNWDMGTGPFGEVTLRSISAWRTMQTRSQSDFDGTPSDLTRFILNNDYEAFSQEIQVIGTGDQIRYTLGFFYFNDDYSVFNPRWNFQLGNNARFDLSSRGGGVSALAGYGQFTWTPAFADGRLDLTVGGRYTVDRKYAYELLLANNAYLANPNAATSGVFQRGPGGVPITRSGQPPAGARPGAGGIGPSDLIPLERGDRWSQFNPEFNVVYRIRPTWTVYGRVATGFKSGGINDTAATNAAFNRPYDPEDLLSFEVGTRFVSPDRRFSVNLSVYHSIYRNFQAGVFVPDLVTTNIINAGEAQFTGVEVEGSVRPFQGMTINFGVGYLDARYTEFILPDGTDVTDTYVIPLAPEWNYLIGGVYRLPLGGVTFEASANWSWRSSQWGTITPNLLAARRSYGTLDARIGLTDIRISDRATFEFAVWGRNLTDTEYWNSAIDLSIYAVRQWADPRSIGIEGRIRF